MIAARRSPVSAESTSPLVLVIGQLPMRADWNQDLARTIDAYLRAGFRVTYVTSADDSDVTVAHPGFRQISVGALYKMRALRRLARIFVRRDTRAEVRGLGPVEFPLSTTPLMPWDSVPVQIAKLLWFACLTFPPAFLLALRERPALLYGYEVFGAPVARLVEALLAVPSVGRFQGMIYLQTAGARKAPLHAAGLRFGPRKAITTNDGTHGDDMLRRHGNRTDRDILFLTDGIDDAAHVETERPFPEFRAGVDVAWANRQYDFKRPDVAIGAWAHFVTRHRQVWEDAGRPRLWMFGEGPLIDPSRRYAAKLGVDDSVVVAGPVRHGVAQATLLAARAVLATNDFSNLTHSVLFALFHGVPVVVRDWGQIEDVCPGVAYATDELEEPTTALADLLARCLSEPREARPRCARLQSWPERMETEFAFLEASLGLQRPGAELAGYAAPALKTPSPSPPPTGLPCRSARRESDARSAHATE